MPYTEFKTQVANKNVGELFARGDSIEGQLKKAVPLPGQQDRTYQQFTTERPTFASDDECYAEARRLLKENRAKLDAIVVRLLAHESLDEPEIYAAAGIARPAVTPSPAPVPA